MNILTFDIEEWFHLLNIPQNNTEFTSRLDIQWERLKEILNTFDIKPTFFIVGSLAEKYPSIIKDIAANYDIGSHGYKHIESSKISVKEFEEDLIKSINILEKITNKQITKYRAPGFAVHDKSYFEVIARSPIEIDCSLSKINHFYGKKIIDNDVPSIIESNGTRVKELPPSVISVFNKEVGFLGGGYFRLFPYFMLKNWLKNNADYRLMYLHLRDFDINQPMIQGLSLKRKFRSYVGIKSSKKKFIKMIKDFSFVDIHTANNNIDWDNVPIIKL